MKAKLLRSLVLALGITSPLEGAAPDPRGGGGDVGLQSEGPVPVLLVPGWWGKDEDLKPFRDRLLSDGWEPWEVLALEFEDPVGSNRAHALEVEAALQELLAASGTREADIVAHSMGGLAVWHLLQEREGRIPVRRLVFLGSPLQGTLTAHLAWGKGGEEMRPGSEFLTDLLEGPMPQRWVDAVTIRTPLDLNVVPVSRGTLPGLGDRMICCPTHQGLLDHEPTYEMVLAFLRGEPPR